MNNYETMNFFQTNKSQANCIFQTELCITDMLQQMVEGIYNQL